MRKLIYGALALSAAMAVGFGVGAKDAKATVSDSNVQVSSAGDDTLKIKATANGMKIMVGVPSFKSNVKINGAKDSTKQTLAVSAWDVYTAPASGDAIVEVDLSGYKKTKDTYLMIKEGFEKDEQAIVVKIPASDVLKTDYDKMKGEGYVYKKDGTKYDEGTIFNYYTDSHTEGLLKIETADKTTGKVTFGYNNAGSFVSDTAQDRFKLSGGYVYVETQKVPTAFTNTAASMTITSKSGSTISIVCPNGGFAGTAADYDPVKVITLPARPSAPVKLNISKLPKAPTVTPNYLKGTIQIPANTEAQYVSSNANYAVAVTASPIAPTSALTLTLKKDAKFAAINDDGVSSSLGTNEIDASAAFAIDISAKATNKNPASRETRYVFDPIGTTSLVGGTGSEFEDEALFTVSAKWSGGKYKGTIKSKDVDSKYTVTYTGGDNKPKSVTLKAATKNTDGSLKKEANATLADMDVTASVWVQKEGNTAKKVWLSAPAEIEADDFADNVDSSGNVEADFKVKVEANPEGESDGDLAAARGKINDAIEALCDGENEGNVNWNKHRKGDTVTIDNINFDLDKVTVSVTNGNDVDIAAGTTAGTKKLTFKMSTTAHATIKVSSKRFGISVQFGDDANDAEVQKAVLALQKEFDGKTFLKGTDLTPAANPTSVKNSFKITTDLSKVTLDVSSTVKAFTNAKGETEYYLEGNATGIIKVNKKPTT